MRDTVNTEMKQDQEIYDKLACWCHTNKSEKTDAVEVRNDIDYCWETMILNIVAIASCILGIVELNHCIACSNG
jgi:hypothetical protein